MSVQAKLDGEAEVRRALARLQDGKVLEKAILYGTKVAHRYLVGITHVDTGAYAAAQRYETRGFVGRLYVDPAAQNKGKMVSEYSVYEEGRGGEHAAYARTMAESGPEVLDAMSEVITKGLIYGR